MRTNPPVPFGLLLIEAVILLQLGITALVGIFQAVELVAGPAGMNVGAVTIGGVIDIEADLTGSQPVAGVPGRDSGAPVVVGRAQTARVEFNDPDLGQWFMYLLPRLMLTLTVFGVLLLLWLIVRTVRVGEVFTTANARRLMALALLVLVGGTLVEVAEVLVADWLLTSSPVHAAVGARVEISEMPVAIGLLLLFFAEVFRRGVRLRKDTEGLV